MADMRKDRRAPASLKVKYKSATVDQFIEQFGTDVSISGMFIKTKTPLDIGALLKLELQLSDASPVIQGVGRVCWRRVPSEGLVLPPGMGIKFVKLEDASRATVERIVSGRGGAGSRFDQTEGAEVADVSEPIAAVDASMPPKSAATTATPAGPPPPAAKPAMSAAPKPPPATTRPVAIPPPSPSLPAAGTKAPPAPRAPMTSPFAPVPSTAPKGIPSVRAAHTATITGMGAATGARTPVAGLFTDSPMARATPEPSAPRSRSSFFPPAPNTNGNAPPPAPAGVSSRPPPAPVARGGTGSGPHVAGAFGSTPRLAPPPAPATRADEDDAIDRLFEDVVQPRSSSPPSDPRAQADEADVRGASSAGNDDGLFADDPPPAPHGAFSDDWGAGSSATTALHASAVDQLEEGVPPDFGDDQFGEADIGGSGAPARAEGVSHPLPIPTLAQSVPAPKPRASSPWPWVALVVAVLAAGGFIVMQRSGADKTEPSGVTQSTPTATEPPSAASAAGAAAPEASAGSAAEAPTAVPAAGAAAAPVAADPAAAAPAAAPAAAAAATVAVEVSSAPRGAEVLVAGKLEGTAPTRVQLPVGVQVELTVRSAGYVSLKRAVTASATPEPLIFKLEPLPYAVTVRTDPAGAEISAEGHSTIAPGPLELGHLDGTVMMSVAKSGYQRVTRPLRLEEFIEQDGQMRAEVAVRLSPLPSGERSRRREREAPPAPTVPSGAPVEVAPPAAAPPAQGSTVVVTPAPEPKPEATPPAATPAPPAAPTPPPPPELPAQP